jgi:hypothetical protein
MLAPDEFRSRWEAEVAAADEFPDEVALCVVPSNQLARVSLPESAREHLVAAGLPKSCAPFLTFEDVSKGLHRIWEVYSPGQWSEAEKKRLEPYLMIGSDDAGNPICIDQRDGRVVVLDHEAALRTVQYVNASLSHLAECLLIFATMACEERLDAIREIDPAAGEPAAFWSDQVAMEMAADADMDDNGSVGRPWWKFW